MSNIITNNYITKSGFYIIDESSPSVIDIGESIYVSILVINTKKPCTLNIGENSTLDFYGFFYETSPSKILINQLNDSSKLNFKILFLNDTNSLDSNIKSYINSNNSISKMNIVGIVKDKKLDIDSCIEIDEGLFQVTGKLDIENIFIGDNGSIKSNPNLFVKSDDIKASHSCKSYKMDENKKFYLKSRGVDDTEADFMLIEAFFLKIFSCLKMIDKGVYEDIYNIFINIIKKAP